MDTAKGHKNLPLITTSWNSESHRADSFLLGTPNNAEYFALYVSGQSLSTSPSREHTDLYRGFILSKFIFTLQNNLSKSELSIHST